MPASIIFIDFFLFYSNQYIIMNIWLREKTVLKALLFGHRGARGLAPENTIPGIQTALQFGINFVEIDVQCSRDNKLVVMHDSEVDRTTNGHGFVHELDSGYIRSLDAGIKFNDSFKNTPVPFLEDIFDFIKDKEIRVNVEIKNAPFRFDKITELVAGAIAAYDYYNKIIVSSFDHVILQQVRELDPKIHTAVLYAERLVHFEQYVKELGVSAVHPHYHWVTQELVNSMHKINIAVNTWVINDPQVYRYYSRMGVDSIGTDFPDRFQ